MLLTDIPFLTGSDINILKIKSFSNGNGRNILQIVYFPRLVIYFNFQMRIWRLYVKFDIMS